MPYTVSSAEKRVSMLLKRCACARRSKPQESESHSLSLPRCYVELNELTSSTTLERTVEIKYKHVHRLLSISMSRRARSRLVYLRHAPRPSHVHHTLVQQAGPERAKSDSAFWELWHVLHFFDRRVVRICRDCRCAIMQGGELAARISLDRVCAGWPW